MNEHQSPESDAAAANRVASSYEDMMKTKEPSAPPTEGIAILGSHPATVEQAPFDGNWLIYACSPHNFEHRRLPRVDQWFEVHDKVADKTRAYPYLKYLETLDRVWLRDMDALPYMKGARQYPEQEMEDLFGPFFLRTSSIALMMAKAIVDCEQQGIPQIGLWGIMQASNFEYEYQRPGIQYFIWEANRRGIRTVAPKASKLFDIKKVDF